MENKKEFISQLGDENKQFYETDDGYGVLKSLHLHFDQNWVYLYEIMQNALDAEANSIKIDIEQGSDALIFQHNGKRHLNEQNIKGLSKVYRSTKGASTVGFMGVGFKSVFTRFQEVRISDINGWKFKFEVSHNVGEKYGEIQPNLIGTVIPIWDDEISNPITGYTTRFKLSNRKSKDISLAEDLSHLIEQEDHSVLAILAYSGLKTLTVNNKHWELAIQPNSDFKNTFIATVSSTKRIKRWQLFKVDFKPSNDAIRSFLEHRNIQPSQTEKDEVYKDIERIRNVVGVLPLNKKGYPKPPKIGRVYATLPTDVTIPFRIHIHADWLLNITRSGLKEININPWQEEIADKIAEIISLTLQWSVQQNSDKKIVKKSFQILSMPNPDESGIEKYLSSDDWLSKLREELKCKKIIPVWGKESEELVYETPENTIVPPREMLSTFENHPEMKPSILLKGHVLESSLIRDKAFEFLRKTEILQEITPTELERIWENGLEEWWVCLSSSIVERKEVLFRLWESLPKSRHYNNKWREFNAPVVRSVSGKWLKTDETTYLNERLPDHNEPGGKEVYDFLRPYINFQNLLEPEWKKLLEQNHGWSETWKWLRMSGKGICQEDLFSKALNKWEENKYPDYQTLVYIGQWAKYRNRPDLVTHVVVDSKTGHSWALIQESLVADPYSSLGEYRRNLFPEIPVIASNYLDTNSKISEFQSWGDFFEKAGALGKLKVKKVELDAGRYNREKVMDFLGSESVEITASNNQGYKLIDYDIIPTLQSSEEELNLQEKSLSQLLEKDFVELENKGKRKVTYNYHRKYSLFGKSALWVEKLSNLSWVPCVDGEFRYPRDVLREPDPAREDVPVAKLSEELFTTLENEGLIFGECIPKAKPLQKLFKLGCNADSNNLAQFLKECRETSMLPEDQERFEDFVKKSLTFPISNSERRVPFGQIVKNAGKNRNHRNLLGDWIVPLVDFEEKLQYEIKKISISNIIPETTSGKQALKYLSYVWEKSKSNPKGLANEVRQYLPWAYDCLFQDLNNDQELGSIWHEEKSKVSIFSDQKWYPLTSTSQLFFDDFPDKRFIPKKNQLKITTNAHLGSTPENQRLHAESLGIKKLSEIVKVDWEYGEEALPPEKWESRFQKILELLNFIRNKNSTVSNKEVKNDPAIAVKLVKQLKLKINMDKPEPEYPPINARYDDDGILIVAGRPVQFAADAAKELFHKFSIGNTNLSADLTSLISSIDTDDFKLAWEKFILCHADGYENNPFEETKTENSERLFGIEEKISDVDFPSNGRESTNSETNSHFQENEHEKNSNGGSWSRERALSRENSSQTKITVYNTKDTIKGEIVSEKRDEENGKLEIKDEIYRKYVIKYEEDEGRRPKLGEANQEGWDICSYDSENDEILRYIEVKGRSHPWTDDQVVELSRAQVNKAFSEKNKWYLYVVEKLDNGYFNVLPIENPTLIASNWIISGGSWRSKAKNQKRYGPLE